MGRVYATLSGLALVAGMSVVCSQAAVETTSENFVGTATSIQGTLGTAPRLNFFGVPLVNPVAYAGRVTALGTGLVVDANATWPQDRFNGTNGYHYVEFDSGLTADIARTDSAT